MALMLAILTATHLDMELVLVLFLHGNHEAEQTVVSLQTHSPSSGCCACAVNVYSMRNKDTFLAHGHL